MKRRVKILVGVALLVVIVVIFIPEDNQGDLNWLRKHGGTEERWSRPLSYLPPVVDRRTGFVYWRGNVKGPVDVEGFPKGLMDDIKRHTSRHTYDEAGRFSGGELQDGRRISISYGSPEVEVPDIDRNWFQRKWVGLKRLFGSP